jgi:Flp pilus assembly protein TadD
VFLPALGAEFVNWDDDENFLHNPNYRGLGTAQLRWMFTTFLMGHYIPLTWLTLGMDYVVWGMNPVGYHFTNLLLHAANAVVFYFVALRLLRASTPDAREDRSLALPLGSGFATLLFAVHPLRAESVAWITERRDLLSALFYLAAIVAYLRYCDGVVAQTTRARRWYWASLGLFGLALLSKAAAVTLPLILLVLDVYPLRRLGVAGRSAWASLRAVVTEKLPFFVLSLAAGVTALVALAHVTRIPATVDPKAAVSLIDRIAISVYALSFYLWKIAVPLDLSAALPPRSAVQTWPGVLGGVVILLVTAAVVAGRRRWPALVAVWVAYIVILSPVMWVPLIAADRYTYLACAGWALLGGAVVSSGWMAWRSRQIGARIAAPLAGLAVCVVAALGILTWKQAKVWHDSETLWTHAVAARPSSLGHFKLGVTLAHRSEFAKATENFHAALTINPRNASAYSALGFALAVQGSVREAEEQFDHALRLSPRQAEAHTGLGLLLARQGKLGEAADHFRRAVESDARDAQAHTNLGLILRKQGKQPEAAVHFEQAVRIDPGSEQAQHQWGLALAEQGKLAEATRHLREAVRINPRSAEIHRGLGEALLRQGQTTEAEQHIQEARRLRP